MKSVSSIVAITALAGAVAGCAQEYSRRTRATATRRPPTTRPRPPTTATRPPPTTVPRRTTAHRRPSYTKSNVYSSKWDYYRNYQGIHDGPERTGP